MEGSAETVFISHRYKAIFVHIQRTGGNSVQRVFQQHDPELVETVPVDTALRRTKHCFASDIEACVGTERYRAYTKFSIVRNPFDRLVSWYSFFADGGHREDGGIRLVREPWPLRLVYRGQQRLARHARASELYTRAWLGVLRRLRPGGAEEIKLRFGDVGDRVMREVQRNCTCFAEFVDLPREHPSGLFDRFHANQLDYLLSQDGELGIDHVLQFESLGEGFARLAEVLGFPGRLPHVNASSRPHGYRAAYDERTRAIVSERFRRDCERFGYDY